jgi:hypothetical protein
MTTDHDADDDTDDTDHDVDPSDGLDGTDVLDTPGGVSTGAARRTRPPEGPVVLVLPVRQVRAGTMPAGLVLMVVSVGLVMAMLLNAPATLRKSRGKVDNAAWRTTIADGVADVSGFFGLDLFRNELDEALGKNQTEDIDIEQVIAESADEPTGDETEVTDLTPVLATPTQDAPLKLYVGGDSMADGLATTLSRLAGSTQLFAVTDDGRVSTGLSRPDYFNWPQHLAEDIDARDGLRPAVAVLLFGANDLQNIPVDGGGYVVGTQEWLDEYRRRVGGTMDLMRSGDNDRVTLWLGMPPMGADSGIDNVVVEQVNHIVWSEASTRPWMVYVDTWSYFVGPDGGYADDLAYADGQLRNSRSSDNIHMEQVGYERMAWVVMAEIAKRVDVSAGPPAPAPSQQPPPEVVARTEVPSPAPLPGG